MYLAKFRYPMGDLNLDEVFQKNQLYGGLSEKVKEKLTFLKPADYTLDTYISLCKDIETWIGARNEEKKNSGFETLRLQPQSFQCGNSIVTVTSAPPPKPVRVNLLFSGSGYLRPAFIDLYAAQHKAQYQQIQNERAAKGLCNYCQSSDYLKTIYWELAQANTRMARMVTTQADGRIMEGVM